MSDLTNENITMCEKVIRTQECLLFELENGEALLIKNIADELNLKETLHLNSTALFIWKMLDEGINLQEIFDNGLKSFEVDEHIFRVDLLNYLHELIEKGFVEVVSV